MKTRGLYNLDFARITVLPVDEQEDKLMKVRHPYVPYSYNPTRDCFPDILNVRSEMDHAAERARWDAIEENIARACRKIDDETKAKLQKEANLQVAEGLYQFAKATNISARKREIRDVQLNKSVFKLRFWWPMIIEIDGRSIIPFFDPRKTNGLIEMPRRFIFSMMHEYVRNRYADCVDTDLAIFNFENERVGPRAPILHFSDDTQLIERDELANMVAVTYQLWLKVLERRQENARSKNENWDPLARYMKTG